MEMKQAKYGAILSYILIIINFLYSIFANPYILGVVGIGEYGVYKTMTAFTSAFMVLDLGLGGTVLRYIARFRADKQDDKIPNFIAMTFIQSAIIIGVIVVVMSGAYMSLDSIYKNGMTVAELAQAKKLYLLLELNLCAHVMENVLSGIITGYNRFFFANGMRILRVCVRSVLLVLLITLVRNTVVLVVVDIFLTLLLLIIEGIYIKTRIGVKIKYTKWDGKLFRESFKYTFLMFLTSITVQFNHNLDNSIIGATINTAAVAVYSYGLMIFGIFEQLSTSLSGVMLPSVTNILATDDDKYTNTKKIIVSVGRIQFILLGGAFCGFAVVGQRFLQVWLGSGFEDVYYITLILMGPALLELCVNVCLSILRAKNMIGFRTGILFAATMLNAVITIVGTYYWNYYAAALGTAFSILTGSVITLSIYYYKKFRFNMIKIYGAIFNRIWICILLSGLCCWLVSNAIESNVVALLVSIATFLVVYALTLWVFGLKKEEKQKLKVWRERK